MPALRPRSLFAALLLCTAPVAASADGIGPFTNGLPTANPAEGAPPNVLSSDFSADVLVQGSNPLENPSGPITQFGFLSDSTRTEPDQNLYLTFDKPMRGATPKYNYGHHFLFQEMRTVAISLMSRASILMWRMPRTGSRC